MNKSVSSSCFSRGFHIVSLIIVACLGCSDQNGSTSPSTETRATPVHAGEIDWQITDNRGRSGSTFKIIPGNTTGATMTRKQNDITHKVIWRFVEHVNDKDQYHFDIRLGMENGIKSMQRDVVFSGAEVTVFEGDTHKIVIRPKKSD